MGIKGEHQIGGRVLHCCGPVHANALRAQRQREAGFGRKRVT